MSKGSDKSTGGGGGGQTDRGGTGRPLGDATKSMGPRQPVKPSGGPGKGK